MTLNAFAAPDAASSTVLGSLPNGNLGPSFCGDASAFYFMAAYDEMTGTLHRWTADGGIESLLPGVRMVVCRDDDVLVATAQGVISLKPDGTEKVLLARSFERIFVNGSDFIGAGSDQKDSGYLSVGNLVTGELHSLYEQGGPTSPGFIVDGSDIYFVANISTGGVSAGTPPKPGPPFIMRGSWK